MEIACCQLRACGTAVHLAGSTQGLTRPSYWSYMKSEHQQNISNGSTAGDIVGSPSALRSN
eukprot:2599840-Amphidinium_carterae.1